MITWSLTLGEEHGLVVFGDRPLRGMRRSKRKKKLQGSGKIYILVIFVCYTDGE
jgi:hypothetical protein